MLTTSLYFWDSTYNTFHLPCGMLTPTLFDVAAITGLRPTGETFDPTLDADDSINFSNASPTYNNYIDHYLGSTDEVSDQEHIAFLALWLSRCVFCCKSLQVAEIFLTLANQLHVGRNVCLSELILAGLYESLGEASTRLKNFEPKTNILLAGPYWLLQLWLNATFEPSLSNTNPIDESDPEIQNILSKGLD